MKYFLFAFAVLAATSQLSAEVMLQPPGLEAGDPYRLIFTTSQRTDGLSADVADYNTFVQSVADAAPEVGDWGLDWTAIVSTPTVDARDNSGTNPLIDGVGVPIYRVTDSSSSTITNTFGARSCLTSPGLPCLRFQIST